MQLRLAQVHLKLGEVAMESESYKESIEDMLESCKILQEVLPPDDRAIAEVYPYMIDKLIFILKNVNVINAM